MLKKLTLIFLCLSIFAPTSKGSDIPFYTGAAGAVLGLGACAVNGLSNYWIRNNVHRAIAEQRHQDLQRLIQQKNLIEVRHRGSTPLHTATYYPNSPAAVILLAAGANPNVANNETYYRGETALIDAARRLNKDTVSLLVSAGALPFVTDNAGRNAFQIAERGIPIDGLTDVDPRVPDGGPEVQQRRTEVINLLQSPQEAKKHVVHMLINHAEIKALPNEVKRNLLNRIDVNCLPVAAATFIETGSGAWLHTELNKHNWTLKYFTAKGTKRPALPADAVRHIQMFLIPDVQNILQKVEAKARETNNQEILALTRIAQENEQIATPVKNVVHNKNKQAKWRANHKGFYRTPKLRVYENA